MNLWNLLPQSCSLSIYKFITQHSMATVSWYFHVGTAKFCHALIQVDAVHNKRTWNFSRCYDCVSKKMNTLCIEIAYFSCRWWIFLCNVGALQKQPPTRIQLNQAWWLTRIGKLKVEPPPKQTRRKFWGWGWHSAMLRAP